MNRPRPPSFGSTTFLRSLLGLIALPLLPELALQVQGGSDLKRAAPIFYYQGIISFLLFAPALLLPRTWSRYWVVLTATLLATVTALTGFYAVTQGARWNLTAHTAMMQTNAAEAWSYVSAFGSAGRLLGLALLVAAFAACVYLNLRSTPPPRRLGLAGMFAGFTLSGYGLYNTAVYGRHAVRDVAVSGESAVPLVGLSINLFHPLTLVAATHYNYHSTHRYYVSQFQRVKSHDAQLAGAHPVAGAVSPRVVVVVIGESATRRHWSLYGYPRPTTPRLGALGAELTVFSDVVSVNVGTLSSIRAMLTTPAESIPVFHLFAGAGYRTHWLSAQHNQGFDDLELSALVGSCDETVFLNGTYDENLLPLLTAAAAQPGPQMIFLNLMGSHVRYRDRYPAKFSRFDGDTDTERLRANYDNSILYTDHVLAEMITVLRDREESSCLLYVSDHGEDVFDSRPDRYLFRDDSLATDPMYEVPFVVWLSPAYVRDNPDFSRTIAAAANRPYQNRGLYHAVLALARLQHPYYEPTADLFSPAFVERDRKVGSMQRSYTKAPVSPPR